MTGTPVPEQPATGARRAEPRSWMVEHRPFLVALAAGVLMRVIVQLAFPPAFIHSDGPTYLAAIDPLQPTPERPVGYVLLVLLPASWVTSDVMLVSLVQHLLGLLTAVVLYAVLRRWGAGRWAATLASLPVLLDTMQLNLEHSVLSDSLFVFIVVGGLALLIWNQQLRLGHALAAGLVLGAAATVRLVGEPLVVFAVLTALVLGGKDWRRRVATAVVVVVGFAVPVAAYATWYHQERGVFALSEFTGKSLYLRSTSFVDCSLLSVPDYQRVLCPGEPVGHRRDPTYYAFHDPRTLPRLEPPPGTSQDQAMREFALAAFRTQPLDYARTAARDFLLNFDVWRGDRFEFETAYKWRFSYYETVRPTAWTGPAYAAHGGRQLQVRAPFADMLLVYQWFGYLPGPLLLGCLVLGLVGAGRARRSGLRAVTSLMLLAGVSLMMVPDLTAEFVWRYQLPALVLLPAAAALGWTALLRRGQAAEPGTVATASTD